MSSRPQALIAGHGQMGHAFETLLQGRARLRIWDVAPGRTVLAGDVEAASRAAEFVFLCVPTVALVPLLQLLSPRLSPGAAVLSIAKGLDDGGRTAADILAAALPRHAWGVLGGPMIANEIIAGRPAFAELGGNRAELVQKLAPLFGTGLSLVPASSAPAVSWCGVLKNIYAPLVGIADERGWGDNARGHLIMIAVREMQMLLTTLAGGGEALGDAGLADFVTTVTSASSHHYGLGRALARGTRELPECEGLHSLRVLEAGARVDRHRHPLYAVAAGLVSNPAGVPQRLHDWLAP